MTGREPRAEPKTPVGWLVTVCVLTAGVLALCLDRQIFDTNFYALFESTSLLAGDRPYRDFFEWGIPLQAAASAAMQWLVGNRMVGEFVLLHWPFIITGAALSFALGCRLSGSPRVSFVLAVLALGVLPDTPTFHYPKLLLYPLGIWLAWRYLDDPRPARAAALGCATAVAFLFRHDHGIYLGGAAALSLLLSRWASPPPNRRWPAVAKDAIVYAAIAVALLAPWLLVVHRSEGLADYVRARATLYEKWSDGSPYRLLLTMNPRRVLGRAAPAVARPGVVSWVWHTGIDATKRADLEREYDLRLIEEPGEDGRWRYQVDDVNAARLYDLRNDVNATVGVDWERLSQQRSRLPTLATARIWQAQVTLLVPLLLLVGAAVAWVNAWRRGIRPPDDAGHRLLAGAFLAVVGARLFRDPSYAHLVAPVTASMATWFLAMRRPGETSTHASPFDLLRIGATVALIGITVVTTIVSFQPARLFAAGNVGTQLDAFHRMLVTPPIDAFVSGEDVERATANRDAARPENQEPRRSPELLLRYMHDCTRPDDRVLVSGSTPFDVNYLIGRPLAGGHLFWHHRWRADAVREAALLALIQSQSIPFAYSTTDPILDDLEEYPRIRQYFADHYRSLPGTSDRLLVDTRREARSSFGPFGFPCFE